ncbi:tRNA1(Val) (adenine(37)-N6)-methyltransferase [Candidatus Halocynthiibacter alkanivorans]|jgi:tRNA1(Val) A37 N6-methylase TrmN6|uniref:tRNA1(Val) (adenine(37)-N6)-methyltransferase n=1 Tax=Candidatus Halocynthiibacter alkanivorans TaxID=2267619 RepID=UPI000DF36A16|nr:methyltransferase [Candidatus Halocynthiibacter alkanivorans]
MQLTQDDFLGGALRLWQPVDGYRAGVDPVLLAAAVEARAGQSVLDIGCGVGAAILCLGQRVPGLELAGLELQAEYASLAQRNAEENGLRLELHLGNLEQMPEPLRARNFDHVIANPPYYLRDSGTGANDTGRGAALTEHTPLSAWMDAATRRLKPRGLLTVIQKADRLRHLMAALDSRMGSVRVQPVAPRDGRLSELVILQARKGGRADFRLEAPLILHAGARHEKDGDSYRPEIRDILRDGAAFQWKNPKIHR